MRVARCALEELPVPISDCPLSLRPAGAPAKGADAWPGTVVAAKMAFMPAFAGGHESDVPGGTARYSQRGRKAGWHRATGKVAGLLEVT